jgi:hypothetical protein
MNELVKRSKRYTKNVQKTKIVYPAEEETSDRDIELKM